MFAYLTLTLNASASTVSKTFSLVSLLQVPLELVLIANKTVAQPQSVPPCASIGMTGNLCDVRSNMIPFLYFLPTSQVGRRDLG